VYNCFIQHSTQLRDANTPFPPPDKLAELGFLRADDATAASRRTVHSYETFTTYQ